MNKRISTVALVAMVAGWIVGTGMASRRAELDAAYAGLALLALVPIVAGPGRYRLLGAGGLLLFAGLLAVDYVAAAS